MTNIYGKTSPSSFASRCVEALPQRKHSKAKSTSLPSLPSASMPIQHPGEREVLNAPWGMDINPWLEDVLSCFIGVKVKGLLLLPWGINYIIFILYSRHFTAYLFGHTLMVVKLFWSFSDEDRCYYPFIPNLGHLVRIVDNVWMRKKDNDFASPL